MTVVSWGEGSFLNGRTPSAVEHIQKVCATPWVLYILPMPFRSYSCQDSLSGQIHTERVRPRAARQQFLRTQHLSPAINAFVSGVVLKTDGKPSPLNYVGNVHKSDNSVAGGREGNSQSRKKTGVWYLAYSSSISPFLLVFSLTFVVMFFFLLHYLGAIWGKICVLFCLPLPYFHLFSSNTGKLSMW